MKRYQRGMSLIELTFVLVIITALLLMATRYYRTTALTEKVNDALTTITAVYTAASAWHDENGIFPSQGESLTALVNAGLLPKALLKDNSAPWGGRTYLLAQGNTVTVQLNHVPKEAGARLSDNLEGQEGVMTTYYDPIGEQFEVTFGLEE